MILAIIKHPLHLFFPTTLTSAVQNADIHTVMDKKIYSVCPNEKCFALHNVGEQNCNSTIFGRLCGTSLGYRRRLSHGRQKWTAYKKFQFVAPSTWLKKFYTSEEFVSLLEYPSVRSDSILKDVKDGHIWQKFASQGFFDSKFNLALMLNVDWFRPFKRSEYKVAAIMMTVLNLPREERYKKKWTIMAGIYVYNNRWAPIEMTLNRIIIIM